MQAKLIFADELRNQQWQLYAQMDRLRRRLTQANPSPNPIGAGDQPIRIA
jgi:hypothetical protein